MPPTLMPPANFSQALLSARRLEQNVPTLRAPEPTSHTPNDESSDTAAAQRSAQRQTAANKAMSERQALRRQQPNPSDRATEPSCSPSSRGQAGLALGQAPGMVGGPRTRGKRQTDDSADGAGAGSLELADLARSGAATARHGGAVGAAAGAAAAERAQRENGFNAAGLHTSGPDAAGAPARVESGGTAENRSANGAGADSWDANGAHDAGSMDGANGTNTSRAVASRGPHRRSTHTGPQRLDAGERGGATGAALEPDTALGLGHTQAGGPGAGSLAASSGSTRPSAVSGLTDFQISMGEAVSGDQTAVFGYPGAAAGEPGESTMFDVSSAAALSASSMPSVAGRADGTPGSATALAAGPGAVNLAAGGAPSAADLAAALGANNSALAATQAQAVGGPFNPEGSSNHRLDWAVQAHPNSPDFAREVGATIALRVQEGLQQARLHLNPAELGPVWVHIQIEGPAAFVHLAAQQAETRAALEQALPSLAGQLSDAGFMLAGGGVSAQAQPDGGQQGSDARAWGQQDSARGSGYGAETTAADAAWGHERQAHARRPAPRGLVDLIA